MDKFKAFLAKAGKAIAAVLKKVLSPFLDIEFDPDPYKIAGFGVIVFDLWVAKQVMDLAKSMLATGKIDAAVFGAAAGLVATIAGVASFLFAQGRQADADLKRDPSPTSQKAQE